jgi:hypothetical protein
MAKRIVSITTNTPTAVTDGVGFVDATYPMLLQGGSSTQKVNICEVSLEGQGGASAVAIMLLSRDSTVGTGSNTRSTGQTDAPLDPATAALALPVFTGNQWATTKPQRDSANHLNNFTINAFGGQIFWRPAVYPDQAPSVLGNTASFGEISLSAFTGSGSAALGAYIVYEPL